MCFVRVFFSRGSSSSAGGSSDALLGQCADMKAVEVLRKCEHVPKLCVIDLDKTVWDVFAAESTQPPYRRMGDAMVEDANGRSIRIHAETSDVLEALRDAGCVIGIASLSGDFERCNQLLSALGLTRFLRKDLMQIHSGRGKESHFKALQLASRVSFRDMLFFDDLPSNANAARKLGMTAVLVKDGINCKVLAQGLQDFAARRRSSSLMSTWLRKAPPPVPQSLASPMSASSKVDRAGGCTDAERATVQHKTPQPQAPCGAKPERGRSEEGGREGKVRKEESMGSAASEENSAAMRKRPAEGEETGEDGGEGGERGPAKRARSWGGAGGEGASGGRQGRGPLSLSPLHCTPH